MNNVYFPRNSVQHLAWAKRTRALSSSEYDHHIETYQWFLSLWLLNRAARQSFGGELQKLCSEASTRSRRNSATLSVALFFCSFGEEDASKRPPLLCASPSQSLHLPLDVREVVWVSLKASVATQDEWKNRKLIWRWSHHKRPTE